MQSELLDHLAQLESQASAAPWQVVHLDDNACMSMVAITNSKVPTNHLYGRDWEGIHILATTLVQEPPYVVPEDKCWDENAALIVTLRNHLPELIRLARLGLAAEAEDT